MKRFSKRLNRAIRLLCLVACVVVMKYYSACHSPGKDDTAIEMPKSVERTAVNQPQPAMPAEITATIPSPLMAAKVDGEIILKREGYTCSYNPLTRQPNYVSWALTPQRLEGNAKRTAFSEDPDLGETEQSKLDDYKFSGYSRGHMCPAADNKWSVRAMNETFLLSNICPQTQTLNGGDWEELESACRQWTQSSGVTLYIVCGPVFEGTHHRKLHKRVPVPEKFFKAVVCTQKGQQRGIAFVYNNNAESHSMSYYVCTIDSVERLTGFDLFHTIPQKIQNRIEATANLNQWQ